MPFNNGEKPVDSADHAVNAGGGQTDRPRRSELRLWLVASMLLSSGVATSFAEPALAAAGTITTVAAQPSPIGRLMTEQHAAVYLGHDASGSMYLDLDDMYGIAKAQVGGPLSQAISPYAYLNTALLHSIDFEYTPHAVGPDGAVYVHKSSGQIHRLDGETSVVVVGNGSTTFSGDGGPATMAGIHPRNLAVGADGSIFISDGPSFPASMARIRKVAPNGIISTIAGVGTGGNSGDGGPAMQAQIDPYQIDVDGAGRVVFIQGRDWNGVISIRRLELDGTIGTRYAPPAGVLVRSMAAAPDGSIFFTEGNANGFGSTLQVKRIAPNGTISVVAGSGAVGPSGQGGPAMAAALDTDVQVADVLPNGSVLLNQVPTLYNSHQKIWQFSVGGTIAMVAGGGAIQTTLQTTLVAVAGNSVLVTSKDPELVGPNGLSINGNGTTAMAKMPNGDVDLYQLAGTGVSVTSRTIVSPSGPPQTTAVPGFMPRFPTYGPDGTMYFFRDDFDAQWVDCRIYQRTPDGTISVFAGGQCEYDGPSRLKPFTPSRFGSIAGAADGTIFNSDHYGILRIPRNGLPTRIAGKPNGCDGSTESGNGVPALGACVDGATSLITDKRGNLYFTSQLSVHKIDLFGLISRVTGDDFTGNWLNNTGDGGPATAATLARPTSIAFDDSGNLYIATTGAVRRVESVGVMTSRPAPLASLAAPGRVLDTRDPDGQTIDGLHRAVGRVAGGATYELPVGGRGGVPVDAASVVLNVTVVNPVAGGFVTVYPCGQSRPNASNLNFVAGDIVPNSVLAKLGAAGKICLFTSASTDLLVDVSGYFATTESLTPLTAPGRVLDTRDPDGQTIDGLHRAVGRVAGGATYELPVGGRGGVPVDAASVVLNVTVVNPVAGGFVTVYPCGQSRPNASNLNFVAGDIVPNSVLAKLGAAGKICLFTSASTDVLVDVTGYFPPTG
jgi:hypothetical protein